MSRALALGLRLSWGAGRAGRIRVGLMASGSALAAFVVLTSLGLSGIAARQQDQEVHIAPVYDFTHRLDAPLLGSTSGDSWQGRELRRIALAVKGPGAPVPPGVRRLPQPGEVLLSPALDRLARREPLVAQRFPQRRGPAITAAGLVAPDQLLAYVGVRPDELSPLANPIVGFGDPDARGKLDPRAARTVGLLVLLTLVAPVVMFMATCARLSATTRGQRLAALRLLGLSPRRTQLVNAAETGVVAVTGSLVGLGAWLWWRQLVPEVRMVAFAWYSSQLHLPPVRVLAALGSLVILSVIVGAVGGQAAITRPLGTRRERSTRTISRWRPVPLLVGAGLLAVSWATSHGSSQDFIAWMAPFGAGLALTAVGLVLVVPFTAVAIGSVLRRSGRPAALLAGSRLRHEPAVAGRVTAALAAALFATGFAQIVLTTLDRADAQSDARPRPAAVVLEVWGPSTTAATYRPLSDLGVAVSQWELPGGGTALAATCPELALLTAAAVPGCLDGHTYRVDAPAEDRHLMGPTDVPADHARADTSLQQAGLPAASGDLAFIVRGIDSFWVPDLVVPPGLAPARADRFMVAFSPRAYDPQVITAALAGRSPGTYWNPAITGVDRLDSPRIYRGIIAVGTLAALAIGLAALLVATTDRAIERRGPTARLAALGAPRRTIHAALALQILPVSILVLTMSAATAVIGGSSYLRWADRGATLPIDPLVRVVALSIGTAILATLMAATATRARPGVLRDE